jgi:ABC-2 type transport system permease protein
MNIYLFEIKSQLKSFLIWTASIIAVYLVFMTGMFNVFLESKDAFEKAVAGFPPAFRAVFSLDIEKIFTFGGFYAFVFAYIALVGAIMAVALSVGVFSREKRSKCADFLLAKPVSRGAVYVSKLLAVITLLAAANILFILVSAISFSGYPAAGTELKSVVWAAAALFFTQLVFMGIGTAYAVFTGKVRSVPGVATAFGFGGFILSALHGLLDKEAIRFIAPLEYFDTAAVFETGGYEMKYVLTAAAVTVICLAVSTVRFTGSDAPAL